MGDEEHAYQEVNISSKITNKYETDLKQIRTTFCLSLTPDPCRRYLMLKIHEEVERSEWSTVTVARPRGSRI